MTIRHLARQAGLAAMGLVLLAGAAQADILLNATNRGSYTSAGSFTGQNGDAAGYYQVGKLFSGGGGTTFYHDYFAFDLSGVSGNITSASLILSLAGGGLGPSTATLGIFDYTGSIPVLIGKTGGVTAYNDLGTGTQYGSAVVSTSARYPGTVTITLDAAALAALDASEGQKFALGGAITDLSGTNDILFNVSYLPTYTTQLDLRIPEPLTLSLFGGGLLGAVALRRRKKKQG